MNRGARKLPVFGDDHDRHRFLQLLGEADEKTCVKIHAYALMGNHYHLIVEGPVDHLAAAMKLVGGTYTRKFNHRYGLDGPLFRGRYRSKPITSDHYFRTLLRYVHRNPVAADGPRTEPDVFRWTSHNAYLGIVPPPPWLSTTSLATHFDGDLGAYRRHIEDGGPAELPREGSTHVRILVPIDIERALGVGSKPERQLVVAGGRGVRNHLRLACLLLCVRWTDRTSEELARRYGFRSASGARSALARARTLLDTDREFLELIEGAAHRLRLDPPRAA